MPLRSDIKKVLMIGSGPIVIGQAAEFDYAGTQACRALKEEGLEVVLINSNPATIMTDKRMADRIYIEPLTLETIKRVIEIEKPDSVLSTLGGQTGLTLSMQLAKDGFLESHNVKLLGANPETIDKAEDRQLFKDTMESINQPCIPSKVVTELDDALAFADTIGYPVIVRPAFTLGGTGGGIAGDVDELREIAANGLRHSPIHQILVERCVSGWKEIEFEVIRDRKGNLITVCSMENVDPVGIHTGDSVVIAPAVTLADKEYQMLRTASISIVDALGVEGGCNCQFALNPNSFEYAVIEVNPRVSRSSALASKATGYPIAKVATKIAIGYTLDEIVNAVTGCTYACFEPAIDYVVVKYPRWPFDKFVYGEKKLGTQMKATGEVMAIGTNFEQAVMKAAQSIELKLSSMRSPKMMHESDEQIMTRVNTPDDSRLFAVYEALYRGIEDVEEIFRITRIDRWFLYKFHNLAAVERQLESGKLDETLYLRAKKFGYLDSSIQKLSGVDPAPFHREAVYKMVDTCAAEFPAETPYFYSTYDDENEAAEFIEHHPSDKKTVIVFGSGPIRIGQGIEFDYCSVHCVWALKRAGFDTVIINNNPETVSTDFDTADRLYFEPLTPEDVMNVLEIEQPVGVVCQFGGQTAIKLAKTVREAGYSILGTDLGDIDAAEDRELFNELLNRLGIPQPKGTTVFTADEAAKAAAELGYPVLVRPSYVLGGRGMEIVYDDAQLTKYVNRALDEAKADTVVSGRLPSPLLIDKFLQDAIEIDVDALFDGEELYIGGIMEHVEEAGVHSGDAACTLPPSTLSDDQIRRLREGTYAIAKGCGVQGLINVQYAFMANTLYVIEANPRASRTVPFASKATGVALAKAAARIMVGETIQQQRDNGLLLPHGDGGDIHRGQQVAVKESVLPFKRFRTPLVPPARAWASTATSSTSSPRASSPHTKAACRPAATCSSP